MAEDWSACQYLKFEDERTRPPRDLLAQVPLLDPGRVVDLGCGPGNSTELLIERFPGAEVIGVDSSPDMLRQARERLPNATFVQGDLESWMPQERTDLLFGNAVFQWLPDHPREPALELMETIGARGPWAQAIAASNAARNDLLSPERFYDLLRPLCSHLDIWHTHYYHVMPNHAGVVEWFKGSSLRPFYAALEGVMRDQYLAAYSEAIARAYSVRGDGTVLLKFPRLFILAVR
jgi:trans-aconitate 2-methyltransferase